MHSMFGENAYKVAMIQHLSFTFLLLQHNFFHSCYVIKLPQPISAIYGAPPLQTTVCSNAIIAKHCELGRDNSKSTQIRLNDFLYAA